MKPLFALLLAAAVVSGCDRPAEDPKVADRAAPALAPAAAPAPAVDGPPGPGGFAPLQSQPVKDAIHRALRTGATQRWTDGALAGYAVPSAERLANGCRAVRYTIDQQPDVPYRSVTACE